MESKFIALDKAGEEAEWIRNFLKDIPYWPKPVAPVCIFCDSQAAIGRAGSMMYNSKSRHIRRRHNIVRELLSSRIITIDYVKSKDNISYPLTKGLSREGAERTSKEMGLRPRTSQHGVEKQMVCIFNDVRAMFTVRVYTRPLLNLMRDGVILHDMVRNAAKRSLGKDGSSSHVKELGFPSSKFVVEGIQDEIEILVPGL
ncbi:hypothetical protein T459_26960 [Capsicum annuum]|uniref:Uncharacterized protein n=1 Tax=Capsicum annuum TaxID=4072 RepID=A0A2G2YCJ0_CAPAN|nr:hypothetical protein T459_26960 [Capsicum annuum]